jgi:hypothetical protein
VREANSILSSVGDDAVVKPFQSIRNMMHLRTDIVDHHTRLYALEAAFEVINLPVEEIATFIKEYLEVKVVSPGKKNQMFFLVKDDGQMQANVAVGGNTFFENLEVVEFTLRVDVIRRKLSMESLTGDILDLHDKIPLL